MALPTRLAVTPAGPVEYRLTGAGSRTVLVLHGGHLSAAVPLGERDLRFMEGYLQLFKNKPLMKDKAAAAEHYARLFDEKGSEIYLRPMGDYVTLGRPLSFRTVAEAARRRGEVALGYRRRRGEDASPRGMGGVVVNPPKAETLTYDASDRIIVLAKN